MSDIMGYEYTFQLWNNDQILISQYINSKLRLHLRPLPKDLLQNLTTRRLRDGIDQYHTPI